MINKNINEWKWKRQIKFRGVLDRFNNNNNNNNNNHDDIYSAVIYDANHMREFTVFHLGQSRSALGGHKLSGQAAN